MVEYNAAVIREFADALYRRAESIVMAYTILFGLIGAGVGYVWGEKIFTIFGLCVGGALGYYIALQKVFILKLQAQTALCQVKIEDNTRQNTIYPEAAITSGAQKSIVAKEEVIAADSWKCRCDTINSAENTFCSNCRRVPHAIY